MTKSASLPIGQILLGFESLFPISDHETADGSRHRYPKFSLSHAPLPFCSLFAERVVWSTWMVEVNNYD
jgi:hypothetical protein